jgi:hypothetical protein
MSQLERLLADAEDNILAADSDAYERARFDEPGERKTAVGWLRANPTATGVLLLLALRREAPDAYRSIPAEIRAQVLAAALRERANLNDFGYIAAEGSHDGEAGEAVLELGDAAVGPLLEELGDMSPAQLEGSEESTLADIHRLRRADFAYRYLARVLGQEAKFDSDPAVRDQHIAELRDVLEAR